MSPDRSTSLREADGLSLMFQRSHHASIAVRPRLAMQGTQSFKQTNGIATIIDFLHA